MSDSETQVEDEPPPVLTASDLALARYAARMRPARIGYAAILVVLALVIAVIVVVAYERGEVSHATLHTVSGGGPSINLQAPSSKQTLAWHSTDTAAIGTPYWKGTIVTHDAHTVRGRDARTGAQTWYYTRTDRTVCTAIQVDGVTIAVFKLGGNCDELTAVDSGTGQRLWTRTLDKNGAEFDGPAGYVVTSGNVMFVSATSIYSVDPLGTADQSNGGLDHWVFSHVGCTIHGAVLGSAGALISQTCTHEACAGAKFCGNGNQLLLRDIEKGEDSDSTSNKNNPDQIIWNDLGSDLVPTVADHDVAAREQGGGVLQLFDATTGKAGARLTLAQPSGSSAPAAVASTQDADLVWIGGRTYALPDDASAFTWQAATVSVPTVLDTDGSSTVPDLKNALLAVPTTSGIATLDAQSGAAAQRFAVPTPPPNSLVYPLGTGYVVAGPSTTVYR